MMALAWMILPLATCHLTLSGRKKSRKGARMQGADTTYSTQDRDGNHKE
jgi:hypothetical protein